MKNTTLLRLQHTAKLEKMIKEGESKKLDKFITYELKKNVKMKRKKEEGIDKTQKNL